MSQNTVNQLIIENTMSSSGPHESTMAAQHFARRMFISFERRSINDGSNPALDRKHLLYPPAITVSIISANQCTPTLCHRSREPPRGVTKLIFVRIQTDLLNANLSRSPRPSPAPLLPPPPLDPAHSVDHCLPSVHACLRLCVPTRRRCRPSESSIKPR